MARRPAPAPIPSPRRAPRQARSRDRVERILDAAAAIVDEVGIEDVTTNGVAERAGVPVGTLYQFFPNRDAVLRALLERQLLALDARFGPLITGADPRAPLPPMIDAVVDALSRAYLEIPALAALVQALRGDPRYMALADANNRAVAGWIAQVVQRRVPELERGRARAIATATVEAADGVLMAWLREARAGRRAAARALLDELRVLVAAYLEAVLARR
jgi:AcrR family transcriptional regulator